MAFSSAGSLLGLFSSARFTGASSAEAHLKEVRPPEGSKAAAQAEAGAELGGQCGFSSSHRVLWTWDSSSELSKTEVRGTGFVSLHQLPIGPGCFPTRARVTLGKTVLCSWRQSPARGTVVSHRQLMFSGAGV